MGHNTFESTHFFYKQHFYKQGQAETGKKSKRHAEPELLLFEIFIFLYPRYHRKITGDILKNV